MKYTQKQINEYRAKWLAQLRSPKAKKTTLKLEDFKKPNKRCCLGHACHALGIKREVLESNYSLGNSIVHYENEPTYLPEEAYEKLDITSEGRFVTPVELDHIHKYYKGDVYKNLARINDHTALTPAEIADVIEEQFKANNFIRPGDYYK